MTWRSYLQANTRNPAFLWRMVISILLAGVAVGLAVDWAVPAWIHPDEKTEEVEPEPVPEVSDWDHLEELAAQHKWAELWKKVPASVVKTWRRPGATVLAVLTGLCWLVFAMQAIQVRSANDGRLWLPLMAMLLGILSIWPTVFLIFWQERVWNLKESKEITAGLRFFIAGVGFREELSKFMCFLPLLPWIVRRRDELAALLVAACVGLGFAMEENVQYIYGSVGTSTLARLLTPAPFHMATTGLLGLAAYRACIWPRQCAPQLLAMFGVIVLAHGLYDALLDLPALKEFAIGAVIIFLVLIYQFFRELRPNQTLRVEPISLTANFLFCVSTVAAATFVYLCAAVGWKLALNVLTQGIVAEGLMVYLFLREMPETMVTV
jgi:RsiW-degrading membrane proteinase PrsW (M82 family)